MSHWLFTVFAFVKGAEAHLNTCFKHLIYFINEFGLVESKELAPLQKLINRLMPEADMKTIRPTEGVAASAAGSAAAATAGEDT